MTTPIIATPYGRDTYCVSRLVPGRLVEGAELVGQACYRRLITQRGQLEDDQDYGLSLSAWLGAERTPADVASIPGQIRGELSKDERIDSVDVKATSVVGASGRIELDLTINAVCVNGETFALSLHASDVTVALLGLTVST